MGTVDAPHTPTAPEPRGLTMTTQATETYDAAATTVDVVTVLTCNIEMEIDGKASPYLGTLEAAKMVARALRDAGKAVALRFYTVEDHHAVCRGWAAHASEYAACVGEAVTLNTVETVDNRAASKKAHLSGAGRDVHRALEGYGQDFTRCECCKG